MSSFIVRNLTEIEAVVGCTFACICNTVFRMFSCLQINCQPFYLRQLLQFHPFDWMIEIYLQTEGQGTHHKMVSLQPMPGFSPLLRNICFHIEYSISDLSIGYGPGQGKPLSYSLDFQQRRPIDPSKATSLSVILSLAHLPVQ